MKNMVPILVVLGDGGHSTEMLKLINLLGAGYKYYYMMAQSDRISEGMITCPGPVYRVSLPLGKGRAYRRPWRAIQAAMQQIRVWFQVRPRVILSSGANIAVPIAVFGRLMGTKIIHVETGSRVYTMSATGKVMYKIAHLFFVQWEPLQKGYPKAIYAGRLM